MKPELLYCYHLLGLDPRLPAQRGWPVFREAGKLCELPPDRYGRIPLLRPDAAAAWLAMQAAAERDGILLELISAFRSYRYQTSLLQRKLASGQALDDILAVSALPGCSEHHTGCAIDLACGEADVLETAFAETPAFAWLTQHGAEFGFTLSFPEGNRWGYLYEPWHWCYQGNPGT